MHMILGETGQSDLPWQLGLVSQRQLLFHVRFPSVEHSRFCGELSYHSGVPRARGQRLCGGDSP